MELIENSFLLFGGKGGVGKTTMAAATAQYAALQGKKTLVLSTDPAHSLGDSFGTPLSGKIAKIKENLFALEIDASQLLKEYKHAYGDIIKQIADEGTFFSKDDIQQFFDLSLPGMDELMALLKIINILENENYDLIVVDTAPTGHTIRLLELPQLMMAYVQVLAQMRQKHRVVVSMMVGRYVKDKADEFINKMYADITRLLAVLKQKTTQFVPVLIPEALAVRETQHLLDVLKKHKLHSEYLIINRVVDPACSFCTSRRKNQEKYLQEIEDKIQKPFAIQHSFAVPFFAEEAREKGLEKVAQALFERNTSNEGNTGNEGNTNKGKNRDKERNTNKKWQADALKQASVLKQAITLKPTTKFLLCGGKGGVGKTSCAAAMALKEGKKRKVLIFSTDPAHSLSDAFDTHIGNSITKIDAGLDALEIDSYSLLNNIKKKYKKEMHAFFSSVFSTKGSARIDAPYDRQVMEGLFDLAPPGIDEIMALKMSMDLLEDAAYDLFILDTAPSGHTIRLLEMPQIAEEWTAALLDIQEKYPIPFEIGDTLQEIRSSIQKVRSLLLDKSQSTFVMVTIPEAMGVLETEDLHAALKRLQINSEYLIINKLVPLSDCGFCQQKHAEQQRYCDELQKLGMKICALPLFETEIKGIKQLQNLGDLLMKKSEP